MLRAILSVEKETKLKQKKKSLGSIETFSEHIKDGNLKIIDAELKVDPCSLWIIPKHCLASC